MVSVYGNTSICTSSHGPCEGSGLFTIALGTEGWGGGGGGGGGEGGGGKGAATDGLTVKGLLMPRRCVERQHAVPSYAAATMVSGKQHMKRGGIYSWDSQYKPMYIMPVTHHNHVST